jgi:competence protein ComEA
VPPAERRALLLLLALAVAGQGVRLWLGRGDSTAPPGEIRLPPSGAAGSLAAHRDSSAHVDRPLRPGETIDLDRAGAGEIARLPRIGPGLARRIVDDRTTRGPFGSLEGLSRVAGVGDGLIAAVRGQVVFTGGADERAAAASHPGPLDVNAATEAELEKLPGVGPSLARRIVEYRGRHGPFAAVDSLVRVWGIGPRTLERLRGLLTAR